MNSAAYEAAVRLTELLKQKGATAATAESCTGGAVSAAITSVPGASDVFELGITSYSCKMKNKILGVDAYTLKAVGAVSGETARQMAEGVRCLAGARLGLSVTGVAGPGGSEGHAPGLVYIAVANPHGTEVRELHLAPLGREYVRSKAAAAVLKLAVEILEEKPI